MLDFEAAKCYPTGRPDCYAYAWPAGEARDRTDAGVGRYVRIRTSVAEGRGAGARRAAAEAAEGPGPG